MTRRIPLLALLGLISCAVANRTAQTPAPPNAEASNAVPATPSSPAGNADSAPLPLWPEVTHGKLANGVSYSILKHGKPEKRAFLWLAVNAGSVQEDDNQQGLAHFDEHMAFDGTAHFKKLAIIDYIEKIGMRFGADLNAYTSFDQTVYQLELPTDHPEFLSTGLDILRDWAGEVSYDPGEVERERGVVLEEWRLGRGAGQRLFDKQAKVLFQGTRNGERLPIGQAEIIKSAPREELLRFYRDFYRPDLMSVVVVGDVDPAAIEAEIGKRFSDLKNPSPERPHTDGTSAVPEGTRISIETDHEAPSIDISIYNILPHRPEASRADFRRSLVEHLYSTMLNERLNVIRHQPDAPFRSAYGGIQRSFTRELDAFARSGEVKGTQVEQTLRSLLTETLRIEKGGFTASELSRAQAIVQRGYDESAAREATVSSRALMQELVRNFFNAEFVIGAKAEDELVTQILPSITLNELNQVGAEFGGDKNRVILISGPDTAKLPNEARVREILGEVQASQVEAWSDAASAPLMAKPPAPGKIVREHKLDAALLTEWTLSNGVHVVVKPTDFEADSVSIEGFAPGGTSNVSDADFNNARFADAAVGSGGLGELDSIALGKALAGKNASANVSLSELDQSVSAGGSVRDLETVFQLLHLKMTAPRRDPAAFAIWRANNAERIADEQRVPEMQFAIKSAELLYAGHPRRMLITPKDVEAIELDKALELYKNRYGDASGFTFVIVGSVDLEKLRPLVETYLASLPASGRKETERDLKIRKAPGLVQKTWELGEAPKASLTLDFHGDESWSRDKERDVYILGRVLSIRLREVLRSSLGGVYGVSAGGSLSRSPHQERNFTVRFGCDPNNLDKLIEATHEEVLQVIEHGASDELLGKVKETYLRERETQLRENRYWLGRLVNVYRFGDDPAIILDSNSMVARMTSANVAAAAKLYLDDKQVYRAVMLPAANTKAVVPTKESR